MVNLKEIVREVEDLFSMKQLVTTYEEIASMKMQRLRGNVLARRSFIYELAELYQELITSYKEQILELLKYKKRQKDSKSNYSVRAVNGKTACVFLSANSGLFGEILRKTYKEFITFADQHNAEPIIIGEFGKKLFEAQFPHRKYIFFTIGETGATKKTFKDILDELLVYENVVVFYARFESMASQNVAKLDFSAPETETADSLNRVHYLFEPSLETILEFFEKQIFSSILDQTFTESDLARYAARMILLDRAMEKIGNRLKEVDLQKLLATHRVLNKKQIETLSSISMWKL